MVKNVVTKWRNQRGVTKAHLARQICVSRSYVTRLEQGDIEPSGEVMFRIAEYFQCKVEDVFQRVVENDKKTFFAPKTLPIWQRSALNGK